MYLSLKTIAAFAAFVTPCFVQAAPSPNPDNWSLAGTACAPKSPVCESVLYLHIL